jgi:hypothetical protein
VAFFAGTIDTMRAAVRFVAVASVAAVLLGHLAPTAGASVRPATAPATVAGPAALPPPTPTIDAIAGPADASELAVRVHPPDTRPVGITSVYVIGDSLTFGAQFFGGLNAKLANAGYQARVDGKVGRFIAAGATILDNEVAHGRLEPVVFVALGDNEVANHWSAKNLSNSIDQLMGAAGERWVIWMTIQLRDPTLAATFNSVLAGKQQLYRHLLIADWHAVNLAGLFDGPIHLTPTGYNVRADFMVNSLNSLTLPH